MPPDPLFDELDLRPCQQDRSELPICYTLLFRNGDIRKMLVNAAIDQTLVKRIFEIGQESTDASSPRILQSLEVSSCDKTELWNAEGFKGYIRYPNLSINLSFINNLTTILVLSFSLSITGYGEIIDCGRLGCPSVYPRRCRSTSNMLLSVSPHLLSELLLNILSELK